MWNVLEEVATWLISRVGLRRVDGVDTTLPNMGAAWSIKVLEPYVQQFGNDAIYGQYGEIGGLMLADIVRQAGYTVKRYGWHYTGKKSYLLHFLAELERE